MKRPTKRGLILFTVIIAVCAGYVFANPLLRTDNYIRNRLLKATPLGTSMNDVKAFIESKGYTIVQYREDIGFRDPRGYKTGRTGVVGAKHIRASIGNYHHGPLRANVSVLWGFDQDSRLIDVAVWRTIDAL